MNKIEGTVRQSIKYSL